jgi:threonine/homoserine/homoserine lactone efflux protein
LQLDTSILAVFTLLWLAIVPTPGPNSLLIMRLALTAGWRDVATALAGNLLAIASYALATLLGLSLLLAAAPSVRLGVYLLGGAYLVWVGLRLVGVGVRRSRHRDTDAGLGSAANGSSEARPVDRPFTQGVLTALANVQALFFLSSIFAGVGILRANLATGLAAVGIIVAGNGAYLSLLAWLLQRERPRAFYARYRGVMEIGFGMLFVLFGARLVWRELAAWF